MQHYHDYFAANQHGWNLRSSIHKDSDFYNLEAWKAGQTSLQDIELREMGDVNGKKLLHLQCHFGQDTLSWARMGAKVTGCDFSENAIDMAQKLAKEAKIPAKFVCCNVYDLPQYLHGKFDIVFTSYGTIGWLPDLEPWATVVSHFLKKGGYFYIADFHPVLWMLDEKMEHLKYPYHNAEVIVTEQKGTYADKNADIAYTEYGWNHSLGEIINALVSKGLRIDFLNEYPYSPYDCFDNTIKGDDGYYRIKGLENVLPMVYSIRATKVAF